MSDRIADRVTRFNPKGARPANLDPHSHLESFDWIREVPVDHVREILVSLLESTPAQWEQEYPTVTETLVQIIRRLHAEPCSLSRQTIAQTKKHYCQFGSRSALQALLLRLLIATRQPESLSAFAELVVAPPVLEPRLQVEVFGDLLRYADGAISAVFPQILEGLEQPRLASFILDYANYAHRNKLVSSHPAKSMCDQLIALLSDLADRLGSLQDIHPASPEQAADIGRQVTESVALGVALCDALANMGASEAIASLNKVLQVEHRRLRVEAAAALARLGVEDGQKLLIAMAADPVERLRVLAYAEELGLLDEVDEEHSNIVARAEAEIVMQLSQPTQIGIAPQHVELIDQRELAWPGYDEPRSCFLFQFVYQFPSGEFTNIGIAGPLVMTVDADLTGLPHEDIYGLFAGWHVDHPDIYAVEPKRAVGTEQLEMHRLLASLTDAEEFDEVDAVLIGRMFERHVLIASARRGDQAGWAIVSEDSIRWLSIGNPQRPLSAMEAFHIFVGRSLLASFN